MSAEERKKWEEKSDKDRLRYDVEKLIYKGKWTVPHAGKRCKKDKMAPKRPMSAFLDFSKTFRTKVIQENPQAKNNREISKILGNMWRNASAEEKRSFIQNESRLRAEYNEKISKWRKEKGNQLAEKINMREAAVRDAIDHGTVDSLVKAAEVSQQTLFGTDSEVAFEAPAESSVPHSLPHDQSRYPFCYTTVFGQTFYQTELSSMPQSSARYRQSSGYNIPITSSSLSFKSGHYAREIYSYEGTNAIQQKSFPQCNGRAVSPEQDPRLSYGGWNYFKSIEGDRWKNGPAATPVHNHFSMEHGDHYYPCFEDSRARHGVPQGMISRLGWNGH
jgi:hypothetical protein